VIVARKKVESENMMYDLSKFVMYFVHQMHVLLCVSVSTDSVSYEV